MIARWLSRQFFVGSRWTKYYLKSSLGKTGLSLNGPLPIREHQLQRLNTILQYAVTHSPFYTELLNTQGANLTPLTTLEQLDQLPVITKTMLKKAQKAGTLSPTPQLPGTLRSHTTGSSGEPFEMALDSDCLRARSVVEERIWNACGLRPYRRLLKIWRTKEQSTASQKLVDLEMLAHFGMGDLENPELGVGTTEKAHEALAILTEFRPQVIRGYAGALDWLADLLLKRNFRPLDVESVISSAEYLADGTWDKLEQAFNCRVFNIYGGTEASAIAVSTKDSRELLLSEDLYIVEILDQDNKPAAPGQPGRVVVTDLYNQALPLIRYDIGDYAVIADDSFSLSVSKPRKLTKILGRTNDDIQLPDGSKILSHLWWAHLRNDLWIEMFQIVQSRPDAICIRIKCTDDAAYKVEGVEKRIQLLYPSLHVSCKKVDSIDPGRGGKKQTVIRHF